MVWLMYTITPYLVSIYFDSSKAWLLHLILSFFGDWLVVDTSLNTPFALLARVLEKLWATPAKRNAFLVKILTFIVIFLSLGTGYLYLNNWEQSHTFRLYDGRPSESSFNINSAVRPLTEFNQLVSSYNQSQDILINFDRLEAALERLHGPIAASNMANKEEMYNLTKDADKAAFKVERYSCSSQMVLLFMD